MASMELTPETFEKAEFIERRRGGYDIEQVETFLEETGTEFARMLVKFKQAESRVASANDKASEAESRAKRLEAENNELRGKLEAAEESAKSSAVEREATPVPVASTATAVDVAASHESQVESVARALVIAQDASDRALAQAKAEAQSILSAANENAERQLSETNTKIDALVREAKSRADREFAGRREEAITEIADLESRRSELGDLLSRLEGRISGYRQDLRRAAEELVSIAEDPTLMGNRPATIDAHLVDADGADSDESTVEDTDVVDDEVSEVASGKGHDLDEVEAAERRVVAESEAVADESADSVVEVETETVDPSATADEADADEADADEARDTSDIDVEKAQSVHGTLIDDDDVAPAYLDLRTTATDESDVDSQADDEASDGDDSEDSGDNWEPGSWSRVLGDLDDDDDDGDDAVVAAGASVGTTSTPATQTASRTAQVKAVSTVSDGRDLSLVDEPTEALDRAEIVRDRFLEELDQAVNADLDDEDDIMAAFLEGSSDSKSRRFGWRR